MATIEKLKITSTYNDWNFSCYCSFTLESLAGSAKDFAEKYNVDVSTVTFEFYADRNDDYSDSYLIFNGWRWETDAEFEDRKTKIRLEAAKARKVTADKRAKAKEAEYNEFLRLKEKFEKGA